MLPVSQFTSRLLVRARYPLLALAVLIALLAIAPSRQLDFDRSIENMFSDDDPVACPLPQTEAHLWRKRSRHGRLP